MAFNEVPDFCWRPRRDLNPCYRRERAVSWAGLDDGDAWLAAQNRRKTGALALQEGPL